MKPKKYIIAAIIVSVLIIGAVCAVLVIYAPPKSNPYSALTPEEQALRDRTNVVVAEYEEWKAARDDALAEWKGEWNA